MAKPGEIDWSDLYAGRVGEPEHSLSRPVTTGPTLRKGEVPRRPSDAEIRATVLNGMGKPGYRQATDKELFGHLVVTEEQVEKAENEWQNTFQNWYDAAKKPVEKQELKKTQEWTGRGPINQRDESQLTEEEQRIRAIPVTESDY